MINISAIIEQAQLLLEQNRTKDAEAKIKQILAEEPQNHYALSLLARCFYNNKQYADGITAIQRAIALSPVESFYFYLLGFGFYQQDNTFEALANLNKAIALFPYNSEYYSLTAFALIIENKFEEALNKANEGLALDAESITCLNARAMALNKLKRTDAAIQTMENALSQDPDNEFTHTTFGWNLLERGKHNEAAKHFREALRIAPMRSTAQTGLKEALKSKILPYKWLLQYSFWINNKGKKLRNILPIVLYVVFRILITIFKNNSNTLTLAGILVAVYLLFVVGSWTINSIANFFLLFHADGKYALNNTEKWAAIIVVSTLIISFGILSIAAFTNIATGTLYQEGLMIAGLVCLSLALPLGEIAYPIKLNPLPKNQLFSLLLIATGIASLLCFVVLPSIGQTFMTIYGIGFIAYNWLGVFKN